MFGLKFCVTRMLVVGLTVGTLAGGRLEGQTMRRTRRESNAIRKARIQREIDATYSHRHEISGGGGYLRFRSGDQLKKNNEVTFYGNDTYYLSPKLGILADVHGAYGNAKIGNSIISIPNPQISEYTFTAGPSYRFYMREKMAASVFGTAGAVYGRFSYGTKAVPSIDVGIWPDGWRPAFTAGVNVDYNFYPNLAMRISPTYIGTTFQGVSTTYTGTQGGGLQNNFGFNLGLVYRIGHR